ncbi:hypothetical protein J2W25_002539 [Variovorax boronicumulans]|uniref:GPI inositol-deacylase PGAP1-like alpha/beta domain-containing protein n=1 Tax=Variovorax boronicumulans TaxID=436515 RepID=A0AAW8DV36_9BURK|nr:hypothetical protein [Variovorax boronicumulans]MDP9878480.1 hypothetical protein [Variovorax boronicumulans]MDP9923516.1 hypothetical protein [Variovorax boronicumulans]
MQYTWNLTDSKKTDSVHLRVGISNTLPIIFVPGVMGSNLRSRDKKLNVWRLNAFFGQPARLAFQKLGQTPGDRQKSLHPDRTEVDPDGNVPTKSVGSVFSDDAEELAGKYRARGWGEVGESSYGSFLVLLEDTLNGHRVGKPKTDVEVKIAALMALRAEDTSNQSWRPEKDLVPSTPEDFKNLRKWYFPVYACGYNWLDDNGNAAKLLKQRINQVIAENNNANSRCEQVILVTHSMGGLVARACQQLEGMELSIAGIVHGVMPADGAPVAYRRCKLGMQEENGAAAVVIGRTGQDVTAVFAQAPGALQLLPTQRYQRGWLQVLGPDGKTVQKAMHESDPYAEIYKRRDRWWGVVKEEWLKPSGGTPILWSDYLKFITLAEMFHAQVVTPVIYHPNTYAFYGADDRGTTRSFEGIVWQMTRGRAGEMSTPDEAFGMTPQQVFLDGTNPEYVGWEQTVTAEPQAGVGVEETSQWELRVGLAEASGDGTVPALSGRSPVGSTKVRQVFRLSGIEHEPAYGDKSPIARQVTFYAISKIALEARVP